MRETAMFGLAAKLPSHLRNAVDKGVHVSLPMMSERAVHGDLEGLREVFFKTQKLVFGAALPLVVLGSVFARPLIQIWVGSQYARAAVVMEFLLVAALGDAILYPSATLLYAKGEVKRVAWVSSVMSAAGICGSLLTVSRFGAVGVACAMACAQLFLGGGWFTIEACKACRASPMVLVRGAFREVAGPAVLMVLAIAIVLCFWKALSPLWLLLAGAAIGCAYLGLWGARTALPLYRGRTESAR
jgi:O-antigen/teichoic acid export membrane protein